MPRPDVAAPAPDAAAWFGSHLDRLHPALQLLHRTGGVLQGPVRITVGRGPAGWFGRRMARTLGVPSDRTEARMRVCISHAGDGMHWSRSFDAGAARTSVFTPVGRYPDGHWLERSGRTCLRLQVGIEPDGGWCWQLVELRLGGWPLPALLRPRMRACKRIDGSGRYHFEVNFAWPGLGTLLRYAGQLQLGEFDAAARADVLPP